MYNQIRILCNLMLEMKIGLSTSNNTYYVNWFDPIKPNNDFLASTLLYPQDIRINKIGLNQNKSRITLNYV